MSVSLLQWTQKACPLSNLSQVFGPSIEKIPVREAFTKQREKLLTISYLALKLGHIKKTHTESGAGKSYFNLAYVFLLSAKTRLFSTTLCMCFLYISEF